ncbi:MULTISPECIES: TrmH family RNA methyltransferase [Pseudofrankia]|uniref:TrmH family RNA methyltransferase n=1 Tax=Pseudofrankia TaxID=2994363 RepID=UPI000234D999|nr:MULTISPECIES: RNA methyltransferase [Pseudofrankia]OHV33630.1 RNA methyltransferase [Pseudofrankia sp. EUN1h]
MTARRPGAVTTALGPRAASVAAARRLRRPSARRAEGLFLAEGFQAVEAALAAGRLVELFVGESAADRHGALVAAVAAAGPPVRSVTDAAAAALSETVTPQGLVGVATLLGTRLADLPGIPAAVPAGFGSTGRAGPVGAAAPGPVRARGGESGPGVGPALVAVCVAANDPGNAGTVIRTADAAGADAVIFAGEGVDPFGGKCVRSSAGSLFHLPVVVEPDLAAALDWLRSAGCRVVATSGHGARDLYDAADAGELDAPTGWLFGNEAHGLPPEVLTAADAVLRVPVYGQAESLNLAVATALCLYASARARRMARSGTHGTGGGGRP